MTRNQFFAAYDLARRPDFEPLPYLGPEMVKSGRMSDPLNGSRGFSGAGKRPAAGAWIKSIDAPIECC